MPSRHSSDRAQRRRKQNPDTADQDEVASWDSLSSSDSSSSSSSDDGLASKLPTLPDLRFEQSYLATIRGFLHEEKQPAASKDQTDDSSEKHDGHKDHHHKVEITHSKAKDEHELWLGNLRVEWFPILYVTVRDQLLSPLVQGAVWGFGGLLLTQFRQYMSARAQSSASTGTRGSYKSNASILKSLGISKR